MTSLWADHLLVLAAGSGTNQPNSTGQEFGSSGPVALILIICLFIAVAFLIRSMTKHLKKIPDSFDPEEPTGQENASAEPDSEKQDH